MCSSPEAEPARHYVPTYVAQRGLARERQNPCFGITVTGAVGAVDVLERPSFRSFRRFPPGS
eukprot:66845-Alexandrium_andersonii.AAC.1